MEERTISVSEELKLFVVNSFVGEIEVPIDSVDVVEKRNGSEGLQINFKKKDGSRTEEVCLDITIPMMHAQKHMDEQNARAKDQAVERGYEDRLDRYEIKSMTLKKVFISGTKVRLYFEWVDCFGCERLYYGEDCEIREGARYLYASCKRPEFYF